MELKIRKINGNGGCCQHPPPLNTPTCRKAGMSDNQSTTEYRNIPDFPGYRVGNDGSVWSCREAIRGTRLSDEWHKLSPVLRRGYARVGLWKGGKLYWRSVHRLVLEVFVGPCPSGMEARHVNDNDRTNNHVANLCWGTPAENSHDKERHGTVCRGSNSPAAKLTETDIPVIIACVLSGESARSVARSLRVSHTVINAVINRKTWKHAQ